VRRRVGARAARAGRPRADQPDPAQVCDQVHDGLLAQRARRLPGRGPDRDDQAPHDRLRGHVRLRQPGDLQHRPRVAQQGVGVHRVPGRARRVPRGVDPARRDGGRRRGDV
jgi:hypothetical protein